jgi:ABC-type transport system substrate-binding protein
MPGKDAAPDTNRSTERHRIGETEMPRNRHLLAAVIGVLITVSAGGGALAQKSGGVLRVYSADSPPGLNIYEQATPWGQGPLMSVYNNLILFDQHIAQNRLETIVPDLASRWEWNEDGLPRSVPAPTLPRAGR